MSRLRVWLVAAVVLVGGTSAMVALSPAVAPADAAPAAQEFIYGPKPRHSIDAYLPAELLDAPSGSAARPAVVLVHGGSWTRGDKASMARAARAAAEEGYVALSMNYRLAPTSKWPAQRADLRSAIRWIKANAGRLQVHPEQIFVVGSSAGGEIAAGALTKGAGSEFVRGFAVLSPPLDLALVAADTTRTRDSFELARVVTQDLLGCAALCSPALFAERSAASQLDRRDPAALLFASKAEWVDPLSSVRFHEVAKLQGLDTTLVLFDGERHGMRFFDDAWPKIRDWIAARSTSAVAR